MDEPNENVLLKSWHFPSVGCAVLLGKSSSGKSYQFKNLLRCYMYHATKRIGKVVICYSNPQSVYDEIKSMLPGDVEFEMVQNVTADLFQEERLRSKGEDAVTWIFLDDLNYLFYQSKSPLEKELFKTISEYCHHWRLFLVVSLQSARVGKSQLISLLLANCCFIVVCMYRSAPSSLLCSNLQRVAFVAEEKKHFVKKLCTFLIQQKYDSFMVDTADSTVITNFGRAVPTLISWQ